VLFTFKWQWGAYALLFSLPFERIGSWALHPSTGHPVVRISQIIAAAWITGVLVNVILRKLKFQRPAKPIYLLVLFIGSAILSLLSIGSPLLLQSYVIVLLLFSTTVALAFTLPHLRLKSAQHALFASAAAVSLFGLYQFIVGSLRLENIYTGLRAPYVRDLFGFPRIHSTALEPLYYANYLLIPLLLGIGLLIFAPNAMKKWHRGAWGLVALNLLLTMSRGALISLFISLLVGLVIVLVSKKQIKPQRALIVTSLGMILASAALISAASYLSTGSLTAGPTNYLQELTTKLTATGSFYDRQSMQTQAKTIFLSHPLLGVGLAGITPYLHNYSTARSQNDVISLNNQFFELLAETGIIGTVLFYAFLLYLLGSAIIKFLTPVSSLQAAWLFGFILIIIAITLQAQSFSGFLLMQFWVCYGVLLGLLSINASQQEIHENRN
jgi:O-antigen ligase